MTGRVCVIGSFMMDLVAAAPRRPLSGETLIGTGFAMHLGGKGMNQAVAAARSGAQVAMIGRLGNDDFGARFRSALDAEGIDASSVRTDPVEGTGVGLPVVEPDGTNSIIVIPRANHRLEVGDVEAASSVIAQADALLLQFELPLETAVAAARIAAQAGVIVIVNPAPALRPPDGLSGFVDYLVPNEGEAERLTGVDTDADDGRAAAVVLLAGWSARGVVVTVGERGAVVAHGDVVEQVEALPVHVVDTVGAGDAFSGALAARLAAGDGLLDAVGYARVAAALSCTRAGAAGAMPWRQEVEAAMAGV